MNRFFEYARAFAFGMSLGLVLSSLTGCDTVVELDASDFQPQSQLDKTRWAGQALYQPSIGVNDSLDVTFGFEDQGQLVGRGTYTIGRFADRFPRSMNMVVKEYSEADYTFTIFAFGQAWTGSATLDGDYLRIKRDEAPERTYVLNRVN